MLILSFRDMTKARRGGVTSATAYELDAVSPGLAWNPPPRLSLADPAKLSFALANKHVCFLIHGFNVDRDNGYTGLGALSQELETGGALPALPTPPGAVNLQANGVQLVIPVLWAGDWYLPVNYPFLLPDIRLTGRNFAEFLLGPGAKIARLSFVTHSMGARVALEALQQTLALAAKKKMRAPVIDSVVLTAAAASDQIFDDPNYADAVRAAQRLVVVSSRADTTLSGAFPFGNLVEQWLWPRDPGEDMALGLYGPHLKKDSEALPKTQWYEAPPSVGQNHGDYLPAPLSPPITPYPNGWSNKRVKIGALAQAVLDNQAPAWPQTSPIITT